MAKKFISPDTIRLTVPSNPKYLRALRSLVEEVTHEMGFSYRARREIIHAIDEACTNVIKHGYDGNLEKEIVIALTARNDSLEVRIRDFGKKVPPSIIRHRKLHDVRPGGLGVFFIKQSMDEVHYNTDLEAGTELIMVKHLKKSRRRS